MCTSPKRTNILYTVSTAKLVKFKSLELRNNRMSTSLRTSGINASTLLRAEKVSIRKVGNSHNSYLFSRNWSCTTISAGQILTRKVIFDIEWNMIRIEGIEMSIFLVHINEVVLFDSCHDRIISVERNGAEYLPSSNIVHSNLQKEQTCSFRKRAEPKQP